MATIKKKLPYELYDVAGLEDWFSQMAAEGYHLVECRQHKAEFTVATPQENVRYRLEAVETYQYDWNKDRAYAEQGWDHVATILGFFYIFRCGDPMVPEIHTDPTIQSWTMKKLIRRQWWALIWWPLYWLFLLRDSIGRLFTQPHMAAMDMLFSNVLPLTYAVLLVVMGYLVVCQGVQLNGLRRVKRRLASGLPMDRTRRYPRSFWRHGFMSVLAAAMLAAVAVSFKVELGGRPGQDFALEDYPHVTLEEVLSGVPMTPGTDLNYWTGQELETSLTVPVQLRYGDAARLASDGSPVRIYMKYYETRSPGMASVILKGTMEELEESHDIERSWHEKYPEEFPAMVLDTGPVLTAREGWDELWVWKVQREGSDAPTLDYLGRIENKAVIFYVNLPEPERVLDIMAEKMEGFP